MREKLAKWLLKGTDYHVHTNPGKHPDTRRALNGAVSNCMEHYPMAQTDFDEDEYFERKYGRAKK